MKFNSSQYGSGRFNFKKESFAQNYNSKKLFVDNFRNLRLKGGFAQNYNSKELFVVDFRTQR